MLTTKQNEIIEQIKQEFESHNQVIDLRKQSSSLLNLQTIISDIQERDDFIEETMVTNLANYRVIKEKVQEEIVVLNRELEVIGFCADISPNANPRGRVSHWNVRLNRIDSESKECINFMTLVISITINDHIYFNEKRIDDLCLVSSDYTWRYNHYSATNVISLLKNDYVRDHLSYYWEKFNKK
jgi:hypothetical protein